MKNLKKTLALLLALCMILALAACGQKAPAEAPAAEAAPAAETAPAADAAPAPQETKWLRMATNFAYPSLDAHKDYYGWYTQICCGRCTCRGCRPGPAGDQVAADGHKLRLSQPGRP